MSSRSTIIVRRGLVALSLGAALCAGAAVGEPAAISYPSSRALNDVAAWLQRDTPLLLSQVVDIGPSAVTAITTAAPMGETRGFLANLSSEALDPAVASHDGIASWSIPVEIECTHRQARLGVMTGYRSRDLQTDPRVVRKADSEWVTPVETSPLGSAIRALCDRDFERPFAGHPKTTVKTREVKPGPLPTIEVRAKRVAPDAAKASPDDKSVRVADASAPQPKTPSAKAKSDTPSPPVSIPIPASTEPAEAKAASAKPTETRIGARFKPPAGGGTHAVQIAASPALSEVQDTLGRFKKKFGAELGGLNTEVEPAQVGGKTVNRAVISGFASVGEAGGFCKRLAEAGQACFIRR